MRAALLGGLSLAVANTAAALPLGEAINRFQGQFSDEMRQTGAPGAAWVIVEGDRVAGMGTWGIKAQGSPDRVTENTVFRLASVSKTFAASLTTILVNEGRISLDAPVAGYVPAFQTKYASTKSALTLRDVLSHQTGYVHNAYDGMIEGGRTLDQILPYFGTLKPNCKPGTCYGYQNVLFSIVEPVVEKSTGNPYENLIRDRLFTPLGMNTASVGYEGYLQSPDKASPHVLVAKRTYRKTRVKETYYHFNPAAGVNASITDMSKWLSAQLGKRPDVLPDGSIGMMTKKEVRTLREMSKRRWRPYLTNAHYGLGWRIYDFGDDTLVYHFGAVEGFRALVAYSKSRNVGISILTNGGSNEIDELNVAFWAALQANEVADATPIPVQQKAVVKVAAAAPAKSRFPAVLPKAKPARP
ncbi:serine hydrolase domain-containing protein [Gimibacter soli]|uniref:Serine hydrolase n=1 Tax=Gimibacter soli TaxID=3024400 RepID=A0AAE9XUG4_9PROT|nr:serine hydrolase domain-containing protein [Gimibacter soli]WCL53778.1 serine hydrolase [Gimibacter soli]